MGNPTLVDLRVPGYDVFPSSMEISVSFDAGFPVSNASFTLNGATAVERGAVKITRGKFVIPTRFLALDHSGVIPNLGPVSMGLAPGAPEPSGQVTGQWSAEQDAPAFPAHSVFHNVAVRVQTMIGAFDLEAADVTAEIGSVPPQGVTYSHPAQLKILKAGVPVGKALAKHIVPNPGIPQPAPSAAKPCEPCCSVQAHGHCSKFLVKDQDGLREQLLFVGSQPGVPSSPVGRDRVLVYETITNEGPRAVKVYWDGDPPGYENAAQSAILLPNNTITVAAGRAVKVVYSPGPSGLSGDYAHGHDVISWCCPDPWVSEPGG